MTIEELEARIAVLEAEKSATLTIQIEPRTLQVIDNLVAVIGKIVGANYSRLSCQHGMPSGTWCYQCNRTV